MPFSTHGTYINQGTYVCECGFTRTANNTDDQRGGWTTIIRLHNKTCPLVKSGARNAQPKLTINTMNMYRLKEMDHSHFDQKALHLETKRVIADAKERAFNPIKN